MSTVICYSILDDLIAEHAHSKLLYVGTLDEPINIYDNASKTGCYVVVSAVEAGTGNICIARILASTFGAHDEGSARRILFDAANLVATYIQDNHPSTATTRAMIAVPRGLVWPLATVNFMARDVAGHWIEVATFDA